MKPYKFLFILLSLSEFVNYSQTTFTGFVLDKANSKPINNVEILPVNYEDGTVSNESGFFELAINNKIHELTFTHLAYKPLTIDINSIKKDTIYLIPIIEKLNEVIISGVNTFVKERKTPVASATFKAEFITKNIGTKDLPEILNASPSVFTTKNGGAYGDVSINVRGFDQRNVAVLINNIPVNDMETGLVYWSNWLNLPEVTSTVQIQRGLGASKLAMECLPLM